MEIKTVTMIGMGAVGAVVGIRLQKILGKNMQCIVDTERKARYERDGIFVNGEKTEFNWVTPENAMQTDTVIIATKNAHLPQAIQNMRQAVGENTCILSLLNGIQSERDLAAAYGEEKVLPAFVLSLNSIHEGNQIEYTDAGRLIFGESDNRKTERVQALCDLFSRAGITFVNPDDIQLELWKKYLINVTFNTLSALCRSPYGGFKYPVMQELARETGAEVIAVANAEGIALTQQHLEDDIALMNHHDPHGKTSMLQDMEARRKSENPWFCGTVVQLAKKHGIPTPTCALLEKLVAGTEAVREV